LVGAEDSSSSSLNEQPDESPLRGSRNEEDMMNDDTYYPETRSTDQQVKDAVYAWVLVNQPDIVRYAKELVGALPVFGLVAA
jgi:hypothetical protein